MNFRNNSLLVGIIIAVIVITVIAGCISNTQSNPDKIVIGGTISLSGSYANEGKLSLEGAQAMIKWINEVNGGVELNGKKVPIEYKYYDDESKKELVQSLYEKLITTDKVNLLVAPYGSTLVLATVPITEKYNKLLVNFGGATDRLHEQGFKYVVSVWTPASGYLKPALDMIKVQDPNAKRVAIVFQDDEFSRTVANYTKDYAKNQGFEIVFFKSYPSDATDLTPLLTELKSSKPDIIVGGGHFADGQLLTKQLAEQEINVKALVLLVAPALPDYYKALGKTAEGVMGTSHWEIGINYTPEVAKNLGIEYYGPTQEEFLKYFKLVAGKDKDPSYHSASAAASILLMAKAIETSNSNKDDMLRQTFGKMDLMTFFGRFKINPETGLQTGKQMVIFQWQNGNKSIVWPKEFSSKTPIYPLPPWRGRS